MGLSVLPSGDEYVTGKSFFFAWQRLGWFDIEAVMI
jgi:hypothetical protein